MVSEELVFGSSAQFEVLAIQQRDDQVVLSVQSRNEGSSCPACNAFSSKVHSYYLRKVKDLPAFDNKVTLCIKAKKWYCLNSQCPRKIFTERFHHFFKPYKRNTDRLQEKLLKVALLVGGRPGEKVCRMLNIVISSSSLIRIIHEQHVPAPLKVSTAVGIDEWAFRKGINYGTAIVDLNMHKVVDLLPDRETTTLESWLKKHPEVQIVTRDRFSPYALAASKGLPDAVQVADRWHLLKNMGDALQRLLERKRQHIIALQAEQAVQLLENERQESAKPKQEEKRSPRHQLLLQVKKMYAEGKGAKTIARILQISRNTVKKYIHLHELPQKKGIKRTNLISFSEYLQARIEQDAAVESIQLYREIKSMGYNGGRTILYSYLKKYGKQRNRTRLTKLPAVSWTTAKVKVLLCKKGEQLEEKDKKLIEDICEKSSDISQARLLANKFRDIMESKQGHLLSDWIGEVEQSCIHELKGFARGLLNDYQAVVNALTLPWSNGQVEGQINKLKTIKRQMYGRAGFELLRKRVILHSAYYPKLKQNLFNRFFHFRITTDSIGTGNEIAVSINVTHDIEGHVRKYISANLPHVGTIVSFNLLSGPGQQSILGGSHAVALAQQAANTLKYLKAMDSDIAVHIFAACPNALLFFLGQHNQGIGPCIIYEFDFDRLGNKSYQPSFVIR